MKNIISLFLGVALSLQTAWAGKAKPPHILWITCEDMSPHLGSYGEKLARTPHLDELANDGIRYTRAFATAGVCAPSRAALITGQYQTAIGAHNMRTLQPQAIQQFSSVKSYSAVPGEETRCFPEYLRKAGYYCTNNEKQDYQFVAPLTVWDENSSKADWRGRGDRPFFAVINLMITHESQIFSRDSEPLEVDPAEVIVPPYYPDTETVRRDIARHLTNVQLMDKQVGEIIQKLKNDGLYEDTIIFFFSDHGDGLPFVKREIYDRGLRVPLIIKPIGNERAESTDHQLISFVDLAPTVLSLAGVKIPDHFHGQAFLGKQKASSARKYFFGARDRMATEVDRVRTVGDGRFQYFKNYMPEKPYYQDLAYRKSMASMREILELKEKGKLNEDQRYWFRETKPEEELFDLQTDPWQLKNLADDPKYALKLKELREAYKNWKNLYPDLGETEELALIRSWWGGDEPPRTAPPELKKRGKRVEILCHTPGASIAYKKSEEETAWRVYDKPIEVKKGDSLYIVAHRIGYLPSERVIWNN